MASTGDAGMSRRSDIQGLRAIAVLLVVAYHAGLPVPGGFVGVDIFFVISGFVITRLLWHELRSAGRIALGRFYARRVRRLLPALAVLLGFVAIGSLLFESPLGGQQATSETGAAAVLYTANLALFFTTGGYFDGAGESNPLLHMWTLAVEEQFYLVFPPLLVVAWRARSRRVVVAAVASMMVVSAALCALLVTTAWPTGDAASNLRLAFYSSPTRAWEFAAGALVALAVPGVDVGRSRLAGGLSMLGCVLVAFGVVLISDETLTPGPLLLLPVLGTVLLLVSAGPRWLSHRVLVWIGDRSYGWYLWHWPIIVFARSVVPPDQPAWLVAAAALSLVPAAWSYRSVEQPVRGARFVAPRSVAVLAAACTAVPLALFAGVSVAGDHPTTAMRRLMVQRAPHLDEVNGCLGNLPGTAWTERRCTWTPAGNSAGAVLLLGDSNAGHFAEPVLAAAREGGMSMTLATFGGCPFADITAVRSRPIDDQAGCAPFVKSWTRAVTVQRPTVVFLANSLSYVQPDNGVALVDHQSGYADSAEEKAQAWEGAIHRIVKRWTAAGVRTVVVHGVPHFRGFDLRSCGNLRVLLDETHCGRQMSIHEAMTQTGPVYRAEASAVADVPLASTLNLEPRLCPGSTCSTNVGTHWRYRDGAHLSVGFSRTLKPRFLMVLRSASDA